MPVTPGRQTKVAPAYGCSASCSAAELVGGGRDVEIAEIVATESNARRLAHGQLEPIDEQAVRRVPPDAATAEERDPDVALAVDGQAVGEAVFEA